MWRYLAYWPGIPIARRDVAAMKQQRQRVNDLIGAQSELGVLRTCGRDSGPAQSESAQSAVLLFRSRASNPLGPRAMTNVVPIEGLLPPPLETFVKWPARKGSGPSRWSEPIHGLGFTPLPRTLEERPTAGTTQIGTYVAYGCSEAAVR